MRILKFGIPVLALAALFVLPVLPAHSDISASVVNRLRGKIILSAAPLPDSAGTPSQTIKAYRKLHLKTVTGVAGDEDMSWTLYVTAFLKKKPRVTALSLDFYKKNGAYVANKRFSGTDANAKIFASKILISENDGLNKGQTYTVKLNAEVRGREVTLARTKATFK